MSFVRYLRLSTPYSVLGTLLLGCSQQPQGANRDSVAAATPEQPAPALASPVSQQPPPPAPKLPKPAPPQEFKFPPDASGQALAKTLTPQSPPPPPAERFGTTAKDRTPPAKLITPDPIGKVVSTPPSIPLPKPGEVKPVNPAERLPIDLGVRADAVPQKPRLPETPGITTKARDVNLPPDLPPLGRQLPDRASLDDPTTELGNAAIVTRPVNVPLMQSGFLRVLLPDPFELAEQVKPKIAPVAEPKVIPVPVNPQRPR